MAIAKENSELINQGGKGIITLRKSNVPIEKTVTCSKCKLIRTKTSFKSHNCVNKVPISTQIGTMSSSILINDDVRAILPKFRGPVGCFINSSPSMQRILGLFCLKDDKASVKPNIRKQVMMNSRLIARVFLEYRILVDTPEEMDVYKMFNGHRNDQLMQAIKNVSKGYDGKDLVGERSNIGAALNKCAKLSKGYFCFNNMVPEKKMMTDFLEAFDFLRTATFNPSDKANKEICFDKKKLEYLPSQKSVDKIHDYCYKKVTSELKSLSFLELRKFLVTFLTAYNGRRVGEIASLTISAFQEAKEGRWVSQKSDVSDDIRQLNTENIVTFITGKTENVVSVIIPTGLIQALDLISDPVYRSSKEIVSSNAYLFPSLHGSMGHCLGTNEVSSVCRLLKVEDFTSTKNRHWQATVYRKYGVSDQNMYQHWGHSAAMNKSRYQSAPGLEALKKVAPNLKKFSGVSKM